MSDMLLIFTQRQTPRITYIFKHMFTNMLGLKIGITSKIEKFIAHDGPKLSYGKQPLGNELFFQSNELLFEQGFSDVNPQVQEWGNTIGFFKVLDKSALPYDIFAASFFLLSRYEEYSPHVKDEFGRFPASESLAYKEDFLNAPVVDFWVKRLESILKERFSKIVLLQRNYKFQTIIAVEEAYQYKRKGIMRTIAGGFTDMFQLKIGSVYRRLRTIVFMRKDPYDIFEMLVNFAKQHHVKFKHMFQLSDFSAYDKNVNHNRKDYQSLIKSMADYSEVGLLSGYFSMLEKETLKKEKRRLEATMNRPLKSLLNHKYPMNLPETQNLIADLEIPNTYSMGYPEALGFRAGTCAPFLFYDINLERITPVRLHPYTLNSAGLEDVEFDQASKAVLDMNAHIKTLGGEMNIIFSNTDFINEIERNAYLDLIIRLNEA